MTYQGELKIAQIQPISKIIRKSQSVLDIPIHYVTLADLLSNLRGEKAIYLTAQL
jgi:hypothetical protein